jgi:hypothetical protein
VHLENVEADTLLRYQAVGNLQQAAAALDSQAMSAEQLLYQKVSDPIGATAGAYSLLRFNELDRLHNWTRNLYNWFDWLPDGASILGEHLARAGDHEEALEVLLGLTERGLPIFTDGFSFAQNRLRLYIELGDKHFEATKIAAAKALFVELSRFAPHVDYGKMFLSFTGLEPNAPNEEAVSLSELKFSGGSPSSLDLTDTL